jgi:hypothetical protein
MNRKLLAGWSVAAIAAGLAVNCVDAGEHTHTAAQQFRAKGEPVVPAPDGTIFCEAEEFQVTTPGWEAKKWGENYYAATFANTFLSRKAFLGAPADCDETVATINVDVKEAGKYLALVRYEAAYRFETQFRVKIEQGGTAKLDRLYGARDNVKIWAFSQKLQKEVGWDWGAVENVVWEGHDAYVELQPGIAKISLIAGKQPGPPARRNVDMIMLTRDETQVKERIAKEAHLPLDGWLTQAGDVWLKVHNPGSAKVTVKADKVQEHSPYWVHMRNWKPISHEVEPGKTTDWIEVGTLLDSLNDAQWSVNGSAPCKLEFGLKNAAGKVESFGMFDSGKALIAPADVRYSRGIRPQEQGVKELLAYLDKIPKHGRTPTQTLIYAYSKIEQFGPLYGLTERLSNDNKTYVDWRGQDAAKLAESCQKLTEDQRKAIRVVSLGDEIGLPAPAAAAAKDGFAAFLKANGLDPAKYTYGTDAALKQSNPGAYYWSKRYLHHYGIQKMKELTDVLRKNLPNAHIGANFSPHHGGATHAYLGQVFQWVNCFREDGMTLPWAEDYIWQLPVGTPQMNSINLDLFRAGNRGKPDRKILYYVMPHYPGNTPAMWRRLFYNALGHGMTIVNLFEFHPVWMAYTENHVTSDEMFGMVLKTFRELGLYEDIVQSGQVRPAEVGLWFSQTADIWGDNEGSFAAAKRGLYIAIRNQQVPLDFVVEQDALDGTLKQYKVLYLTDQHVSGAASKKIAEWVKNGGRLFATAGAGMFDEDNQPNQTLRELLGVNQTALDQPADSKVAYIKQDMPFAKPIAEVEWNGAKFPVFGALSRTDGPAVVTRPVAKGETTYCAFLPGLSYFKPAIPLRPVDRGSTDDAMAHFLPTDFDPTMTKLIGEPVAELVRPVVASAASVETTVIESKKGVVIPLINWSGKPISELNLTVNIPAPAKPTLASGGKVAMKKEAKAVTFTFDLEVADALILR